MDALRTPEEAFANLADFPFEPHYAEVGDGLRMAYVDEGPERAAPVLLLHGEPSWSYLYRHMIPPLVEAGHRVVAPDLIGFGRSDKPTAIGDYTYERHVGWVRALIESLDLTEITLFCQDWGGLIGLRLVAEHPDRFARVVASNTGLPTGDQDPGDAFRAWRKFAQEVPEFPTGNIVNGGTARDLDAATIAAYDAPYPSPDYQAGARAFPALVPTSPDDPAADANRAAWEVLAKFDKPFLTAYGSEDPITRGADKVFRKLVPGTEGQPHTTIEGAAHFIQEDAGPELAALIDSFIRGSGES
jgi:haloalkane dehalogenase